MIRIVVLMTVIEFIIFNTNNIIVYTSRLFICNPLVMGEKCCVQM